MLKIVIYFCSDVYLSCSDYASRSLFFSFNKKVKVIKNGIDVEKFKYNKHYRVLTRNQLGFEKKDIVFCHVGNFNKQKNHSFLIDIFACISKYYDNVKLILIGSGENEEYIQQKVNNAGISDKVFFLGKKSDVSKYYSASDCFILPSLFEGFPLSGVEAQTSGLPVVFSDTITRTAKLTEQVIFIPLKCSSFEWYERIMHFLNQESNIKRENAYTHIIERGFDLKSFIDEINKIYGDDVR